MPIVRAEYRNLKAAFVHELSWVLGRAPEYRQEYYQMMEGNELTGAVGSGESKVWASRRGTPSHLEHNVKWYEITAESRATWHIAR